MLRLAAMLLIALGVAWALGAEPPGDWLPAREAIERLDALEPRAELARVTEAARRLLAERVEPVDAATDAPESARQTTPGLSVNTAAPSAETAVGTELTALGPEAPGAVARAREPLDRDEAREIRSRLERAMPLAKGSRR